MKRLVIITGGILLILSSCTSARKSQKNKTPKTDDTQVIIPPPPPPVVEVPKENKPSANTENAAAFISTVKKIDFSTFTGKAEVDYTGGGKSLGFDAKIQMEKDKVIWISCIGPLGIELARAIITQDSVHIINKFERSYISRSISFLQQQLGMPLSLTDVQDILVGNAVFFDTKNATLSKETNQTIITSSTAKMQTVYDFLLPERLITRLFVQDKIDMTKNAVMTYSDYTKSNGINFSKGRVINVNDKNKLNVKMKFTSFSLNQNINTPFSIPKNYSKK